MHPWVASYHWRQALAREFSGEKKPDFPESAGLLFTGKLASGGLTPVAASDPGVHPCPPLRVALPIGASAKIQRTDHLSQPKGPSLDPWTPTASTVGEQISWWPQTDPLVPRTANIGRIGLSGIGNHQPRRVIARSKGS